MWEDRRGVRRSVYGGNGSLVFSQIHHKNLREQRRGNETNASGLFSVRYFSLRVSPSVFRYWEKRQRLAGTVKENLMRGLKPVCIKKHYVSKDVRWVISLKSAFMSTSWQPVCGIKSFNKMEVRRDMVILPKKHDGVLNTLTLSAKLLHNCSNMQELVKRYHFEKKAVSFFNV